MNEKPIDINSEIDNLIENNTPDNETENSIKETLERLKQLNVDPYERHTKRPLNMVKVANRAKNKVARKSRKKNRKK